MIVIQIFEFCLSDSVMILKHTVKVKHKKFTSLDRDISKKEQIIERDSLVLPLISSKPRNYPQLPSTLNLHFLWFLLCAQ